jgi:hypothetical protein
VSPLELVDDRFDKLAEELRASRPTAPAALRTQVRALEPPAPRWTFRLPSRRVGLALAGAALLASFVAAGVTGLTRSSSTQGVSGGAEAVKTTGENGARSVAPSLAPRLKAAVPNVGSALRSRDLAPTAGRLQR